MTAGVTVQSGQPALAGERSRWWRWLMRANFVGVALLVLATPWWGPATLARLDFFRVRRLEFQGVRYASTAELVARLALDSTSSVWNDLDQFATRVAAHPLVGSVDVTRRLPATVIVTIVERVPVALVPVDGALRPADATGHVLPVDPTRQLLDVPLVATVDTAALRFLDGLRLEAPGLYARVIEVRRVNRHEFWMQLKGVAVRSRDDLTVERLGDILRVEESLAQQNQHAVELDLRFQDQVIARLP